MGIEVSALLSLAVGAASGFAQYSLQSDAADQQKKAQQVALNRQKYEDLIDRRKLLREQRMKAASIEAQAEGTGVSTSSAKVGSQSSLATETGSAIAFQSGQTRSNEVISRFQQSAVDKSMQAQTVGAAGSLFQQFLKGADFGTIKFG